MRPRPSLTVAAVALLVLAPACTGQARGADDRAHQAMAAVAALHAGEYPRAVDLYRELAMAPDAPPATRRAYVRVLEAVGRYDQAEEVARGFAMPGTRPGEMARSGEMWTTLGEVLALRGRDTEAADAFGKALAAGASDSLTARLELAVLRWRRGERELAMREFERVAAAGKGGRPGHRLSSAEYTDVGTALRYLGARDPERFKDALAAFDAAIAADSLDAEPRVRLGELFLEKYNSPDAATTLGAVLSANPHHPGALVAEARRLRFDGAPGAMELVRRSLTTNPNFVPAHVMLATLHLDAEDYEAAVTEAEHALAVDSGSSAALAVLAAARWMRGDRAGYDVIRRRALVRDPRDGEFFTILAELSARNRLYDQAVALAREGTRVDSTAWRAFAVLGVNLLRVGQMVEARRALETAFAHDPYDVWTKNTLDLLDSYKQYREVALGHFVFMIDAKEADLLAPYLGELAEEAYRKLASRYRYEPPAPIRVELFRRHADFSVRTVGLAGLGALGVSFGTVLAMDSPAARDAGVFNWGSTFWHELAHTFTLGSTDHRIPRWLSEGLSVYEERRARPGWGATVTLPFLAAYAHRMLLPVSRLNDGFMRPAYPEQLLFSYYEASLVCEMIEQEHGVEGVVALLSGYKNGLSTDQAVRTVLGTDLAGLDARFDAYLRRRFARQLAAGVGRGDAARGPAAAGAVSSSGGAGEGQEPPAGDFLGQLARGQALAEAGRTREAIPYLQQAATLFPEYAAPDGPHRLLARIYRDAGDLRRAAEELTAQTLLDENDNAANLELADLLERGGDRAGAAQALERALFISPYEIPVHTRLAVLASQLGDHARAVRERQAVLALGPVDRADALYQLARAYYEAGDVPSARREVLRALEEAPNFEAAQELLLELRNGKK